MRRCHGDLHLRNIVLLDGEAQRARDRWFRKFSLPSPHLGQPELFDCIAFNDKLATIDIMYDLAFLIMDLGYRKQWALANRALNRLVAKIVPSSP